jgi:peroxiredoxin
MSRYLIAVVFLAVSASVGAVPQIGQPAPAFDVLAADGQRYTAESLKGKIVVLEWTNHDCPFVQKHYVSDNMQALQRQAEENEVVWLSVISSAPGKQGHVDAVTANQLSDQRDAEPDTVLLDEAGDLGRAYGARTTPQMVVIDAEGIVRYMGGIDSIPSTDIADIEKAQPYFANAMLAVVEGETPDPAVTTPYGCSVKY